MRIKQCETCEYVNKSTAAHCLLCGNSLPAAWAVQPDSLCCPNPECAKLEYPPTARFCQVCGSQLRPPSYELWDSKYLAPALKADAVGVLLDPSEVIDAAAALGLPTYEAEARLDRSAAELTGADRAQLGKWLRESVEPLRDGGAANTFAAQREAVERAGDLNIARPFAESVLGRLTPPPEEIPLGMEEAESLSLDDEEGIALNDDAGEDTAEWSVEEAAVDVAGEAEETPAGPLAVADAPSQEAGAPVVAAYARGAAEESVGVGAANAETPDGARWPAASGRGDGAVSDVGAGNGAAPVVGVPAVDTRADVASDTPSDGKGGGAQRVPLSESVVPTPKIRPVHFVAVASVVLLLAFVTWYRWPPRGEVNPPPTPTPAPTVTPTPLKSGPPEVEGMVYIPGGTYKMGRDGGDEYERPAHQVTVGAFYIDKFEVTCEGYQKFVDATRYTAPAGWRDGKYPEGSARLPVEVSWREASAYAKWAGKRLPTEEEWEFAARGGDGRLYPWGNKWKAEAVNAKGTGPNRLTEVGLRPAGASPFGAFDMVGNAWEWVADSIHAYKGGRVAEDGWPASKREAQKVIRGGCYLSGSGQATATYRSGWPEHGADYAATGFRCVKDVEPPTVRK